jgi:hypothetical protein
MTCSFRIGRWGALAAVAVALAGCGGWEDGHDGLAEEESPAKPPVPKDTVIRVEPAAPLPTEGFGQAVAVSRTALAVTDFLGIAHVKVHTYALADGTAVETGTPLRPDSSSDTCFGEALDLEGDLLAVGVPCAEGGAGMVILYAWDGALGAWTRTETLRPPEAGFAGFGKSLALRSSLLAVGAPYTADGRGAVHVYGRSRRGIALEATLAASDGAPWDLLGQALDASGVMVVASAPGRPALDPLTAGGRVHVFERVNGAWGESATLRAATFVPGEESGWAVAAAPGVVAFTGDRFVSHSVHLFELGAGGWAEDDVEDEERGGADCGFAHTLAMDNGVLAVGMPTLDGPGGEYRVGATRLFRRGTAGWARIGELRSGVAGDKIGHALDLSGGLLAVGAPGTYLFGPGGDVVNLGSGAVVVMRP